MRKHILATSTHRRNPLKTALLLLSQLCPTLCDPIEGRPPDSRPWDSPGKSTGVGRHSLLQKTALAIAKPE